MNADRFSRALWLAPFIFVCHFLEESPTFVLWFNGHVSRGITSDLFWRVNISALIITVVLVGLEWFARSACSLGIAVAWFSFLMLANAAFHIVGAVVDRRYVPGLVTAALLYLPFYVWLFLKAVRTGRVRIRTLIATAVLGSLPMLIHGYLILFRGSRLF